MPVWAWIVIAAAVVVAVLALGWGGARKRQTVRLRKRFGPEYDRAVQARDDRKQAEAELREREKRHEQLEIRPLAPDARDRYLESWRSVQARFVDNPESSVREADELVTRLMRERGYPMEDFETRAADISVDHAHVVENYREATRISRMGGATTEELRRATVHYRKLFEELLEAAEHGKERAPA